MACPVAAIGGLLRRRRVAFALPASNLKTILVIRTLSRPCAPCYCLLTSIVTPACSRQGASSDYFPTPYPRAVRSTSAAGSGNQRIPGIPWQHLPGYAGYPRRYHPDYRCHRPSGRAVASTASAVARGLLEMPRHPGGIGVDKLLQKRLDAIVELAGFIEETAGTAEVGFRLLHHMHVEKHHGLAQVVVGREAADGPRRAAHRGSGFTAEGAFAVGPRAVIYGVFHRCRHRAVVLRGDKQQGIGRLQLAAEVFIGGGGVVLVDVFVV